MCRPNLANPLRRAAATWLALVLISGAAAKSRAQDFSFDPAAIDRMKVILSNANVGKARALENEVRGHEPVVVFIPGILGSKLTLSDCGVIWGEAKVGPRGPLCGLAYPSKGKVTASPLESIELATSLSKNIYGKYLSLMSAFTLGSRDNSYSFSYDWRQDNRTSADELEQYITSKLNSPESAANKNVIFIAHSMGGLVFKTWYNEYYIKNKSKYKFSIDRTIYLGTPHWGTASAIEILRQGYSIFFDRAIFPLNYVEQTIINDLSNVGHTFPSIYQLLPHRKLEAVSHTIVSGTEEYNVPIDSLYEPQIWERFDWLKRVRGGQSADIFYSQIALNLKRAQDFHSLLDGYVAVPNATYFFGYGQITAEKIHVKYSNNRYETIVSKHTSGDGRVIPAVAQDVQGGTHPDMRRGLPEGHDYLMNSEGFIQYLSAILEVARKNVRKTFEKAVLEDSTILEAFVQARAGIPFRPTDILEISPDSAQTLEANLKILRSVERVSSSEDAARSAYSLALKSKDVQSRASLLALVVGASWKDYNSDRRSPFYHLEQGAKKSMVFASGDLAKTLFEQQNYFDANKFMDIATGDAFVRSLDRKSDERYFGSIYDLKGQIKLKIGSEPDAFEAWKTGAYEYRSTAARRHLETIFGCSDVWNLSSCAKPTMPSAPK